MAEWSADRNFLTFCLPLTSPVPESWDISYPASMAAVPLLSVNDVKPRDSLETVCCLGLGLAAHSKQNLTKLNTRHCIHYIYIYFFANLYVKLLHNCRLRLT